VVLAGAWVSNVIRPTLFVLLFALLRVVNRAAEQHVLVVGVQPTRYASPLVVGVGVFAAVAGVVDGSVVAEAQIGVEAVLGFVGVVLWVGSDCRLQDHGRGVLSKLALQLLLDHHRPIYVHVVDFIIVIVIVVVVVGKVRVGMVEGQVRNCSRIVRILGVVTRGTTRFRGLGSGHLEEGVDQARGDGVGVGVEVGVGV